MKIKICVNCKHHTFGEYTYVGHMTGIKHTDKGHMCRGFVNPVTGDPLFLHCRNKNATGTCEGYEEKDVSK
jgi:hypothetical protein